MTHDPIEAKTQRILQEVIDIAARRSAEDEARRSRPLGRLIRAWQVLIGSDRAPRRRSW